MSRLLSIAVLVGLVAYVQANESGPLEFHVTFTSKVSEKPFTGRVYVMLSTDAKREPRRGPDWFKPDPFFAADVKDWKPDTPLVLNKDKLIGFPATLDKLPVADYQVQALMDFDQGDRRFNTAPGNGYSTAASLKLDPERTNVVKLTIDQITPERKFAETERVKLVDIPSRLLTKFHGHEVRLRAAVALPESYATEKTKRYPILYEIPGFSGDHTMALSHGRTKRDGVEFLHVVLDPNCRTGHHVFADSANNGPYGQALIEELIPHIEKKFRTFAVPQTRFVAGHSSGGWSSLWLQVRYPESFNGCWSTSPDPVDFRDFQRINLYKPGVNFFKDENGKDRPIARSGDKVLLWFKGFSDMEHVMGHGGQLASFEAVFSPRGSDGQPRKIWDRKTGAVDNDVAKTWEAYDIRLILERDWKKLEPKLKGKIHVYMGGKDTFYLDGATALLQTSLKNIKADATVEIIPDRHHGNLIDTKLRDRMDREMANRFGEYQARRYLQDYFVVDKAARFVRPLDGELPPLPQHE